MLVWRRPIRTYVYVDGFNLYYGAIKNTPFRWLNPVELSRQFLPSSCIIHKLKYFTARVSGAAKPDAPRRQQIYLSALKTLPEVEVHFGRFLAKTIWRPITNLPVADATIHAAPPTSFPAGDLHGLWRQSQHLPETARGYSSPERSVEVRTAAGSAGRCSRHPGSHDGGKGSDVNLAAHLLNDAWKGLFEAAVVISNDTDLVTPIRMTVVERGKTVVVVCPGRSSAAGPLETGPGR